jgi:hypothetical protein
MYFRDKRKEDLNAQVLENTSRNSFLPRLRIDGKPRGLCSYDGWILALEQSSAVLDPKTGFQ